MEVANVKQGEMELKVKVEQAVLKLEAKYDGKGANAGVSIEVEAEYFLEKLKEAIPGKVDDAVIDVLKVAFKSV